MLGREIGRHHKDVSSAIKLACLPSEVISAFSSTADLQYRFQAPLAQALANNSDAVLRVALDMCSHPERPPAKEVFQRLIEAADETPRAAQSKGGGPSATPGKGVLYAGAKAVGRVVIDEKNRARITLCFELTGTQQSALHKHMAAFVKRHLTEVVASAVSSEASPPPNPADVIAAFTTEAGAKK